MNTPAMQKTYRGRTVLDVPALTLEPGRVYAVIGGNGSGKTTLCRLLCGALDADAGRVRLPVTVGYLPQKSCTFALTVRRNLLLTADDAPRAEALLSELGLASLQNSAAHRLSGGETARMALARVLMRDVQLLLLDEPTAAMDTESTLAAERLVAAYVRRTRACVLLVTHSPAQAERLAGETLFLDKGLLVERGATLELLRQPGDARTQRFLAFNGY